MRRQAVALALTFALLVTSVHFAQAQDRATASWRVALTIDSATAKPAKMFEAFDTSSLNLYDFNGDGQLEIVANNDNNHAYVLDARTGGVLAELTTTHPGGESWPVRELNPIAIGALYGDGIPCLAIPNSAAYLTAFCYNPANSTATRFEFTKKWEVRVDTRAFEPDFEENHRYLYYPDNHTIRPEHRGLSMDGNAFMADSNKDGKKEVYVELDGFPGQFAFNHDGSYRWSQSWADGNAGAKVVDLDKDGRREAVFASDGGLISVFDASAGNTEWTFDARKHGAFPGSIPVPPLIADLRGTGQMTIIFGARNVSQDMTNPDWINQSHAVYYALDARGKMLWNVSYPWMNPLQYNHPAAADVNDDGVLDAVFLDWNTVGHKPGNWNTTKRMSNLFALDGRDGAALWHRGINVYWSNKDVVIADVDGDGRDDIIAPTSKGASDGLGVYSLSDGSPKGWFGVSWQLTRGPVAGDLYGDGKLEFVLPISRKYTAEPNYRSLDVGYREGSLLVIETGADYGKPTFSANILNSDEDKLSSGLTPPTPPPVTTTAPPPTTTTAPPPTTTTAPPPTTTSTPPTTNVTTTPPTTTSTPPKQTTPTTTTTTTTTSTPPLNATTSTPPPTESVTNVPGPGLAMILAGLGALTVLRRRRD